MSVYLIEFRATDAGKRWKAYGNCVRSVPALQPLTDRRGVTLYEEEAREAVEELRRIGHWLRETGILQKGQSIKFRYRKVEDE